MLRVIRTGGVVLLLALAGPARADGHGISGKWISDDHKTVVALAPCPDNAATICATILEEQRPAGERSRIGDHIGIGFAPQRDGSWAGKVVGANGMTLPATLTLPRDNQFDMRVCLLAVICDGVSYYRAKP